MLTFLLCAWLLLHYCAYTLQVLARSSPQDKYLLVCRLNGHGLPKDRAEWEVLHPELDWNTHRSKALPGYWEEVSAASTAILLILVSTSTSKAMD
jgi:hypothetical protein